MEMESKSAPTLPVSVENQQPQARAARPPFLHLEVQVVNLWMFCNAIAVIILFAVAATICFASHTPWEFSGLLIGILWCSMPQAAAAALALLLPRRRWRLRRAAAYAALALNVASQCMCAAALLISLRGVRGLTIAVSVGIFICAMGDLLAFLSLLRGEWAN